jgi:ATP/maltotriose-dependent transcriptional regulator MalT
LKSRWRTREQPVCSVVQADYEASKKWVALAIAGFKNNEETVCRQEYGYANAILALIAVYEGQDLCATACAREALQQFEELDNQRGIVIARYTLAQAYFRAGEYEKAGAMLEAAIASAQRAQLHAYVIVCAQLLSAIMTIQGNQEQAVVLWSATEALRAAHPEQLQQKNPLDLLTPAQQPIALKDMRTRLGSKSFTALWQRGQQMTIEQALRLEKSKPTYIHQRNPSYLTRRETEVLCLVATGLTDAQVAHTLSLSARTISWHLASIYSKIHVSSRAAATRYALENRLLDQPLYEKNRRDSEMIL